MSYSQNMDKKIKNFNSSLQSVMEKKSLISEVNHTRGGYIYKILNSLLISTPKVFATYLLNSTKHKRALIQNSQCKSIAMILVTLLTLPEQNSANNAAVNNQSNFSNENNTKQNENLDLLSGTLELRLELLSEIVTRCITTIENKEYGDLHNNFCYVINNLFLREFQDKKIFIENIVDNFYDELLKTFLDSKIDNLENKLGVVVLSLTGTITY